MSLINCPSDKLPDTPILYNKYGCSSLSVLFSISVIDAVSSLKNVSFNEPVFQGHFPNKPVLPGVLILEAMAQATGILAFTMVGKPQPGELYYFASIDNARFKRPVVPGDKVVMRAEVTKVKGNFGKVHAEAFVDDQLAAQADLTYALQAPIKEEEK